MDNPQGKVSEKKSENKAVQDWVNFLAVSKHNGWLTYKRELEKLLDNYTIAMDNISASKDLLKNYQLIKKGLKMALDIPKVLEIKAKVARNKEEKKKPNRIKEFFRVGT